MGELVGMEDNTTPSIFSVKPEQITRIYSGRPGCGCGCRGTYITDNPDAFARKLKFFQRNADKVKVNPGRFGDNEHIFYIEHETRYHWLYTEGILN